LLPNSVRVETAVNEKAGASHNVVSFKIQAQLWAQPAPIELMMRTDIDLETGQTKVEEVTR
jgi:type VI secretion system protein ImpF